jgi:NTP pyrophosphatase (non-canonical NTP hydrolase)
MEISELVTQAYENAVLHGWHEEDRTFGELIALCHSELSEALEEYRNGNGVNEEYTQCKMDNIKANGGGGCGVCATCMANKPEGIPSELADVVIRIADMCGKYNIDLQRAIVMKMKYNQSRPFRHGNKII